MKKQRKRTPLVIEHLEGISRAAIGRFSELVTEFARGKSGVYALYKGESLYYVGLAKNLRSRLHHHLRDYYIKLSKQYIGTVHGFGIVWIKNVDISG